MISLGVDLGTSSLRAAYHHSEGSQLARFSDGGWSLPAAVTWNQESFRLGHAALSRAALIPHLTVLSVKRLLGRAPDDPLLACLRPYSAFPLVGDDNGQLALALGHNRLSPETVAAALLSHAVDVVELARDARPTAAVLCAPSWFTTAARAALERAASLAKLETLQVVSEPAAIALALNSSEIRPRLTAIVDVGAGGCSAAIVEVSPGAVRVLAAAGAPLAGGDDVDWALVRAILHDIERRLGAIPRDACFTELLRRRCEGAKRNLQPQAAGSDATPLLKVDAGRDNPRVLVDQRLVNAVLRQPLVAIRELCRAVLQAAAIAPGDLSRIVLAGGMTRLAVVREEIACAFGTKLPCDDAPEGAVALGAARHAASLAGLADFVALIDNPAATTLAPTTLEELQPLPPPSVRTIPPSARQPLNARIPVLRPVDELTAASPPAQPEGEPCAPAEPPPESVGSADQQAPAGPAPLTSPRSDDARPLLEGLVLWAKNRARAHDPAAALDLLDAVEQAYATAHSETSARAFRRRMERTLFTREWLEATLNEVTFAAKADSRSVAALSAALAAQPHDGLFEMVLSRFGQVDSPLVRAVLLGYLERFVHQHEAEVSEILRNAEADQALNLLATLRQAGTEQAKDAAAAALASEHGLVRLQAITLLGDDCPVLSREVLCKLIDDPEPEVRTAILEVIRTQRLAAAGPAIARRIRASAFDRLGVSERELLLSTAASLSRGRAEELAIFILDRAEVFTSEVSEQSRSIAARFLATSDSADALEALERAASRRWVNSQAIRDTAARGVISVQKRRATRPPPARS